MAKKNHQTPPLPSPSFIGFKLVVFDFIESLFVFIKNNKD